MRILNLNKLRFKWKVFAFLLGFCFLLLIILWLFQTVYLNDMYKIIRKQELRHAITLVEKEIDNPDLQTILLEIQDENDIIVAPTRDFIPPNRQGRELFGNNNMPLETITEVKVFKLQSGQSISLTFYALVVPVNATIKTLQYQLYFISGIMIILAVGLAFIGAKIVSKPIEEITHKALNLAKGDYETHFNGKGFLEVVTLSNTLNTTAVELGRVEALRRELMANVSHDLRTPLSLIYSYAELMNDFPFEIKPEQTQVIMDETKRLTDFVNELLDISKLESDIEKLNITRFNITQSIQDIVDRIQKLLQNENFNILFKYKNDVYLKADKTKLDRAFYNLLLNAVNYSGDGRIITIEQSVFENRVRIDITDSGEGIAEDDLPYIWDRYYKSCKKHKRAVIGSGLGLFIVKKIIEMHGGKYGVISKIDKGSTFWFEIEASDI